MVHIYSRSIRAVERELIGRESSLKIRTLRGNDELKDDEIYFDGNAIKVPLDIPKETVFLDDRMTNEQLMEMIKGMQKPEENFQKNEVPDDVLDNRPFEEKLKDYKHGTGSLIKSDKFGRRIYPDGWEVAYYPAGKRGLRGKKHGKKPHIDAIKLWVEHTKLASMSQMQLEDEYRRVKKIEGNVSWSDDKMEDLVDSIAYLVARKIWYVGRRSSRDNDETWDEHTRDMRPPQGSFDSNEDWGENGFPYGDEYTYSSGEK